MILYTSGNDISHQEFMTSKINGYLNLHYLTPIENVKPTNPN